MKSVALFHSCLAGIVLLIACGCVTEVSHESKRMGSRVIPADPVAETKTVPNAVCECRAVKSETIIGRVGYDRETFVLNKGMSDGVSVSQKFVLCVRVEQKVVRLAPAAVQSADGQTSTLRLDLRNVQDEDGDLIVVEGGRVANEFRADPAKFIAEHEVFAVAVKTKAVSKEGMLK